MTAELWSVLPEELTDSYGVVHLPAPRRLREKRSSTHRLLRLESRRERKAANGDVNQAARRQLRRSI